MNATSARTPEDRVRSRGRTRRRAAAVAAGTALLCLAGLPATSASAAPAPAPAPAPAAAASTTASPWTQSVTGPMYLTNGAWSDHVLCASADDDNVWLKQFDAANPYCQWIRVGVRDRFALFNPAKKKVASYIGGNEGAVVMQNLNNPTPWLQLFSWGGGEDWGAYALQSFDDRGQNVDAKSPNSDNPRTDAVHTRGWRHGHQRELTWNELPVAAPSMARSIGALEAFQNYLNATLGNAAPDEVACVTEGTPLKSAASGQYVSTELAYGGDSYGMLRARAGALGPWEQYNLCRNNRSGVYSIRSAANGRWVSAELAYGGDQYGELRARADVLGPWEKFTVEPVGGNYALKSAANGQYVSAELAYGGDQYGELRARAGALGPWEQFQ
ncbi:hypothetical protein [Kitasatospora sp. NPDC097643]|uniref:fascin domain-containing protein n=1 Tax=Kitasatospora sp. NPDC097643 TaxID=3157230 RepID=UPI003330B31A